MILDQKDMNVRPGRAGTHVAAPAASNRRDPVVAPLGSLAIIRVRPGEVAMPWIILRLIPNP